MRWRIEHDYRELKHGLGLDHFEGRTWRGWHHHVPLVTAAQESTREPFLPWQMEKAEVLARIAAEVQPHSRLPDSGDVCWFTVP
jgi:hypothetical protein